MSEFTEFNVKFNVNSRVKHSLFIRQHRVREKDAGKPTERTVFVAGVPPFITEKTLKQLFAHFGNISAVYIHKSPSPKLPPKEKSRYFKTVPRLEGFKVAYVVFEKPSGMEKALENEKEGVICKDTLCSGFKKWAHEYNDRIPDTAAMEKEINQFMQNFDQQDTKKQAKESEATEMDDEGWITVTKKSRKPGFARKESVMKQLTEKGEKRRQKKELTNFYRFQIKESKMKNLVSLRQKFEEDKKRIAALKATRRFKPF